MNHRSGFKRTNPGGFVAWMGTLAVGVLAMFGGCTSVGPDYEVPDLAGRHAADWMNSHTAGETTSLSNEKPVSAWWSQFEDHQLDRLIKELLESNLMLAEAHERIVEARVRRAGIHASQLPQVDLTGQVLSAGTGDEALTFQGPPPGQEETLFIAGALAGWELDMWGRVGRLIEAADYDIEASIESYRHMAVSLASEMTLAYVDARTMEQRLNVLDWNIALLEDSLGLAESRWEVGSGTELDVKRAERILNKTRANRATLTKAQAVAYHRIAVLLGKPPAEKIIVVGEMPGPPKVIGMGLPAELIIRRPDIRQVEREYAATIARVGEAVAHRYPRLTLTGSLTFQTDDAGSLIEADSLVYSFGPSLTFSLFDGGRIERNISIRESQSEQVRLKLHRTLLDAVHEVEDAAVGVIQNQERVGRLREAVEDARRSVVLAEQLFDTGLGSLFQLIDSQRELVAIEDALLVARQNELGEIVRLYRALGGGWFAGVDSVEVVVAEKEVL